jgi:ATP-dependent Lon protease
MEVINLGWLHRYREAADRQTLPGAAQITENGLQAGQLTILDDAIDLIASALTRAKRECDSLREILGRVARKVALRIAKGEAQSVEVDATQIPEYLGPPRFYPEQARKELPAGVATGMAWTEMGGEVLFIEATLLPRRKGTDDHRSIR